MNHGRFPRPGHPAVRRSRRRSEGTTARAACGWWQRSWAPSEGIIFAVNKETGVIETCSGSALVGKRAAEFGMKEGSLRDGFMDFFTLNGMDRYGCSVEKNGLLYYCALKTDSMFNDLFLKSLTPGLMFLAAYVLLALMLMAGYTDKRIDASGIRVIDDHDWAYRESEMEADEHERSWWERKSPECKAGFVLMVLIAAGIAALAILYSTGAMSSGNMAIIPYVISGIWTRGFNLFALTRIVILIGTVALVLLGMKALTSVLCGILEAKGKTVCKLTCSLLRLIVIIVGLFFCLEALGFDTTTLLASLGIFSLALSLGAKDLVSDILSGIMIVFSGEYQIGDIVEISGFRGRVWAIGVRCTTVVNRDGNMKNISNRNVSDVINLSRLHSRFNMKIYIPSDHPMDEVRQMLDRELPRISKEIGDIADCPYCAGITGGIPGYTALGFYAECAEEDMVRVCDKVNTAVRALFREQGIQIR